MRADPKREAAFGVAQPAQAAALLKVAPAALPPLRESDVHLGDAAGGAIGLDLQRLLAHRMLIQANPGAGKSWLLRRLIEQAWGRVQQLAVDPDGELVTLTEKFDIAVLTAADVLKKGARAVAAHLRQHRYSALLDLSDASAEDRLVLVADFAAGLIEASPEHWHPLLVMVDEAQTLAPHYDTGEVGKEIKKRCVAALADMMGRGRKRGIAGVLSTTRLAETAMAVRGKANNLVIGRTTMDTDLRRAGRVLGYTDGGARVLSSLGDGEFIALGPALAGGRRVRFKGGPVQTTHKGATPALTPPPAIAAASVAELVRQMPDADVRPEGAELTGEGKPSPGRRIYVVNGVKGRGFQPGEDAIIREGYAKKLTILQICSALEAAGFKRRVPSGVSARGQFLGCSSERRAVEWSEAEDKLLRAEYRKGTRIVDIAGKLTDVGPGRSRQSVQMRAIHLGITVDRVNYWSDEETKIALKGLGADKSSREIIVGLKRAGFRRGVTSIGKFRQKHGFRKPHDRWTEVQDAVLRQRYAARVPVREIAAELGRPMHSVTTRAHRLGIKQRQAWTHDEQRILVEAHEHGGRLIDAAGRIRRPYANVAAMAKRMGLSFRGGRRMRSASVS